MSFELEVQKAIYSLLSSYAPLTSAVSGIFDAVPQEEIFPYVTIGEDVHNEWDTYYELGSDASITIHTWSRYRGRKETKELQGHIYDALHRESLNVDGYVIISVTWESSQSFMDADGLTRHGVQIFRVITERV